MINCRHTDAIQMFYGLKLINKSMKNLDYKLDK